MASPGLLPSPTSANSDLTRQSSTDPDLNSSDVNMTEFIKNIYTHNSNHPPPETDRKTRREGALGEITLEEFLRRMGVVGVGQREEDDVKVGVGGLYGSVVEPGLDMVREGSSSGSSFWMGNGGRGKGKKRVALDPNERRQRRMIKNRESAARSRERKQAYIAELETLVSRLEEEKLQLQNELASRNWERYKQLMKTLIPFEEKQKPENRLILRRARSAHW